MTITALPTPPTRQDPGTFASRGDAFLAALPTFVTEANSLASDVNSKQAACSSSETNAANSAAAAANYANTAQSAVSAVSSAISLSVVTVSGASQSALAGNLYILQNASATTVTLPSSPSNGDVVAIKSANGRFDNVVSRNGKQIEGVSEDMVIDIGGTTIKLQYINSVSQWRVM